MAAILARMTGSSLLDVLGQAIGAQPPTPEWGAMLSWATACMTRWIRA